MKNFEKKWLDFINAQDHHIELKKVIKKYAKNIKKFIHSDFTKIDFVKKDIDWLQDRQNKNNYAKHKDGYSQLKKLINGWLLEDIIRILLSEWRCEINGDDWERKVGAFPSNEPDLKFRFPNKKIGFIEITNINKMANVLFDNSYNNKTMKFDSTKWWQGRANKYINLKDQKKKNPKKEFFILNASDDLKSIMIKKVTSENGVTKNIKWKWHDYINSMISLDKEYFIFSTEGMSIEEISKKIKFILEKLTKGDYET